MRKCQNFANNLELIRKIKEKSFSEFSQELGIPKSTLQSLMKDGNTTLDTAIRIADSMNMSIDALLQNDINPEKYNALIILLRSLDWFARKSPEQQHRLKVCIVNLLDNICDSDVESTIGNDIL